MTTLADIPAGDIRPDSFTRDVRVRGRAARVMGIRFTGQKIQRATVRYVEPRLMTRPVSWGQPDGARTITPIYDEDEVAAKEVEL